MLLEHRSPSEQRVDSQQTAALFRAKARRPNQGHNAIRCWYCCRKINELCEKASGADRMGFDAGPSTSNPWSLEVQPPYPSSNAAPVRPQPAVLGWGQGNCLRFRWREHWRVGPGGGFDSGSGRDACGIAPSPMDWGDGRIGDLSRRQPRARLPGVLAKDFPMPSFFLSFLQSPESGLGRWDALASRLADGYPEARWPSGVTFCRQAGTSTVLA